MVMVSTYTLNLYGGLVEQDKIQNII